MIVMKSKFSERQLDRSIGVDIYGNLLAKIVTALPAKT
jgi:hypothetical protein